MMFVLSIPDSGLETWPLALPLLGALGRAVRTAASSQAAHWAAKVSRRTKAQWARAASARRRAWSAHTLSCGPMVDGRWRGGGGVWLAGAPPPLHSLGRLGSPGVAWC